MLKVFGISRKTLYNKIAASSHPEMLYKYSDISGTQLDVIVRDIKRDHPNDGEVMIAGHLLNIGICVQRSKLRESIHRVDPHRA